MTNFRQHIEGKSVAIVGRAEYLNVMAQGDLIDSHDTVIRAHSNLPYPSRKFRLEIDNDESFVPTAFQERLGKKTTVFAPANLADWGADYADAIIPPLMARGCLHIMQHKPYNVDSTKALAINDYISDKYLPVFVASPALFQALMRQMDYSFPMPGTILINEIVKMSPRNLYVTGFSCYQDNKEQWLNAEVALFRDHKPLYDLRYLRDMVRRNSALSVDSEMTKYFENL